MAGEVKMLMKDEVGWEFHGKLSAAFGFDRFTFQQVLEGEFLVPINGKKSQREVPNGSFHPPNYQLKRNHNIVLHCDPAKNVVPLVDDREIQLLEGICSLTARRALFVNPDKFNWAKSLTVGKEVSVNILSPHLPASSRGVGVVRYIGPVTSLPGWQLGVEIVDNNCGCGTTDGTFRNQRYFECGHNNGIFVSLDKVSPLSGNDPQKPALSAVGDKPLVPDVPSCGFKNNERVMVYDKRGKEVFGRVRWWGDSCKSKHFGFMAVGIETEVKVSSGEFEGNVDSVDPPKAVKSSHWLVMPATMVIPAAKMHHSSSMSQLGNRAPSPIPGYHRKTANKLIRQRSKSQDNIPNSSLVRNPNEPIFSQGSLGRAQKDRPRSANRLLSPYDAYNGHHNIPSPVPRHKQGSHNPYNLGIDSRVQTRRAGPNDPPRYGVIKWIGHISGEIDPVAGVELDVYLNGCADGMYEPTGKRFFSCAHGHGLYTPLGNLSPDQRHLHVPPPPPARKNPVQVPMEVKEYQAIQDVTQQMFQYLGNERGIQGHQNSCYLDSTLFGLFALSDVFDTMFLEPDQSLTSDLYRKRVAELLWKRIVNPLRKNGVVRFESVMRLRIALDELGKMEGITEKEKDPEEFLNMLFKFVLQTEPFFSIKRPSGVEQEFFIQLFVEHDPNLRLPTVGDLLHRMFRGQQISFKRLPSKLLVQVPRFGREYKAYKRLVPELKLKIGDLAYSSSKVCTICGEKATVVCESCQSDRQQSTNYCQRCSDLFHKNTSHKERAKHKMFPLIDNLDLLSVICIETCHYVCFTRDPRDDGEKRWIFFDSMADRKYDKYNIPRVTDCTRELNEWVYQGDRERLFNAQSRELPELVRRFTQDVYMCVYVQPDIAKDIVPDDDMKCKDDVINELAKENCYLRDENTTLLQKIETNISQKEKSILNIREQEEITFRQLADKDEQLRQLTQQFKMQEQQLEDKDQQLQRQQAENEKQKQQLEDQNQELRRQQAENEKQKQQLEDQNQELRRQQAENDKQKQQLEDQNQELRRQQAENDKQKPERRPTITRRAQVLHNSWSVHRREVVIQEELGRGAWGTVSQGLFRKQRVAVKCVHKQILHQCTVDNLKREIQIMAQVQHPNLVRLLAAVVGENDESPLLVLELLDKDLRSAYQQNLFSKDALVPIFRDIAYALHYLHEHQEPIIHRDVSAPNVLLKEIAFGVWKAKLSDFGSANLAKHCTTLATGAIVYAAPETFPPSDHRSPPQKQTTKIDVFSYGYLLVEAVAKKMPSPDNRSTMLKDIERDWRQLYDIVIACIRPQPEKRLTMSQVLEKLNNVHIRTTEIITI